MITTRVFFFVGEFDLSRHRTLFNTVLLRKPIYARRKDISPLYPNYGPLALKQFPKKL
jgi:hypothetical protein